LRGVRRGSVGSEFMATEIVALQPEEQEIAAHFLASVFAVSPDFPFIDPLLFHWKYFLPRSDWSGPRSWVLKEDGHILAHAGIWPLSFLLPGKEVRSMHIIDWAGKPDAAGAGVVLYREVARQASTLLGVGGSRIARKVVRMLGFPEPGRCETYVRVIRPWRQHRTRGALGPSWKKALKLLRNTVWSLAAKGAAAGWSAKAVDSFSESVTRLWERHDRSRWTFVQRTPAFLNYVLACPAGCRGFLLFRNGELAGRLLLSQQAGQTRVADLWIASGEPGDWAAAYALAIEVAGMDPRCCELTVRCSTPLVKSALLANGFRFSHDEPIWLHDPSGLMNGAAPLHIQALDSDSFLAFNPSDPYLT